MRKNIIRRTGNKTKRKRQFGQNKLCIEKEINLLPTVISVLREIR